MTDAGELGRFLAGTCPECGTPGPQRHLSAVGGCQACAGADPRPVAVPLRNRDAGVVLYDLVLPGMFAPHVDTGWREWRAAGGNLVTEEGRRVPWPTRSGCYRIRAGMVHIQPGCRC